jgi:hypothetical protein
MRASAPRSLALAVFALTLIVIGTSRPTIAQSKNPIQAAKDAFKKAQEEQRAKTGQPTPAPQPGAAKPASAAAAPALGDCCTAAAIQKLAGTLGFVDIVGIKLGMTPEEAIAAIKASNPKLKIDILRTEVVAGGQRLTPEPRWIIAHTGAPDGTAESIGIELTMPHGAPQVVGKIVRWVQFANTAPVAAPNLVDAMKKKYGATESLDDNGNLYWVFDASGKQVKLSKGEQGQCVPGAYDIGFPMDIRVGQNDVPTQNLYAPATSAQFTNVAEDSNSQLRPERYVKCAPYTWIEGANLGSTILGRQAQWNNMIVMLQSPALLRNGAAASYAVLKAADDAAVKKQEDDANRRGAPKL